MPQIYAVFDHSPFVELAISELLEAGIGTEAIHAVPLLPRRHPPRLTDSIHREDGVSLIATGMALATAFAVVGASLGYSLAWGPIYCGLIGVAAGFGTGLLIDLLRYGVLRRAGHRRAAARALSEVLLVVDVSDPLAAAAEETLWRNRARSLSVVKEEPEA